MLNLELVRDTYSRDMGTFGKLSVMQTPLMNIEGPREKLFECDTVERPWAGNAPNISCIPEGIYPIKPRRYYRGGYDAIEICDVPGRSLILIHIANTPTDVEGCVGPGFGRGWIKSQWSLTNSTDAFHDFMEILRPSDALTMDPGEELGVITITQYHPPGM